MRGCDQPPSLLVVRKLAWLGFLKTVILTLFSRTLAASNATSVVLCPPGELTDLVVPPLAAENEVATPASARTVPLPEEYARALAARESSLTELQRVLQAPGVDPAQAASFAAWVEAQFTDWLRATGQMRTLRELSALGAATAAGISSP
jgi:hypothetical protein